MVLEGTETEVKFLVRDLPRTRQRLEERGATLIGSRVLEVNLRFDTPEGALRREGRALRLRQDDQARLTHKGPSRLEAGMRIRSELEVEVGDFGSCRRLLEALGYIVTFRYEKYRTTYRLAEAAVMLDELPYGLFVEIEGEADAIRGAADLLSLRWSAAVPESYLGLFEKLRQSLDLPFADLTFENFERREIGLAALGVMPADG